MSKDALRGYTSWRNQRQRCNYPKDKRFMYYGAKGIIVRYSSRNFISWWLNELKLFTGTFPTVGRINHNEDYCFENIEMVDMKDNVTERNLRLGNPTPSMAIKAFKKDITHIFDSIREASRYLNIDRRCIKSFCQNNKIHRSGYLFSYIGGQ